MATKSVSPAARQILHDIGLVEPEDWDVIRLESLLYDDRGIAVGVMYPGPHDPGGIPLIRAGDLADSRINPRPEYRISPDKHQEYRRTELAGGELLISLVGDVGRCAVVSSLMAGWNAARAVAVLRFKDPSDATFIRACLMSTPLQRLMRAWSTTTVQATLNLKEIRQIPLPWPPKDQRDAIAHILEALDEKIDLNRQMNATLEGMARALFKSWFVDFEPVRAKAAGRDPHLPKPLADLFPASFEESALGEIPNGWRVRDLSTVVDFVRGIEPGRRGCNDQRRGLRFIRVGDVTGKRSAGLFTDTVPAPQCQIGDVLVVFDGTPGAVSMNLDGIFSSGIRKLTPRANARLPQPYLWSLAVSERFQATIREHARGTTIQHAGTAVEFLRDLEPGPGVMAAFSLMTAPMWKRLLAAHSESSALAGLRDALLPKLVSGAVRVAPRRELAIGGPR